MSLYLSNSEVADLAIDLHKGQKTADGRPYFSHPAAVRCIAAEIAMDWPRIELDGFGDQDKSSLSVIDKIEQTALLHDVLEDQGDKITMEGLFKEMVHHHVIDAVMALTKRSGENYADAVARAKANPIARIVKMADNDHNSQLSRVVAITKNETLERTIRRQTKYLLSYLYFSDLISFTEFKHRI